MRQGDICLLTSPEKWYISDTGVGSHEVRQVPFPPVQQDLPPLPAVSPQYPPLLLLSALVSSLQSPHYEVSGVVSERPVSSRVRLSPSPSFLSSPYPSPP